MTLSKFIKELQKLEKAGHGRATVGVNKRTLWDGNETFCICEVAEVDHDFVSIVDGDGFTEFNKDGTERTKSTVIIKGLWFDN